MCKQCFLGQSAKFGKLHEPDDVMDEVIEMPFSSGSRQVVVFRKILGTHLPNEEGGQGREVVSIVSWQLGCQTVMSDFRVLKSHHTDHSNNFDPVKFQ